VFAKPLLRFGSDDDVTLWGIVNFDSDTVWGILYWGKLCLLFRQPRFPDESPPPSYLCHLLRHLSVNSPELLTLYANPNSRMLISKINSKNNLGELTIGCGTRAGAIFSLQGPFCFRPPTPNWCNSKIKQHIHKPHVTFYMPTMRKLYLMATPSFMFHFHFLESF